MSQGTLDLHQHQQYVKHTGSATKVNIGGKGGGDFNAERASDPKPLSISVGPHAVFQKENWRAGFAEERERKDWRKEENGWGRGKRENIGGKGSAI